MGRLIVKILLYIVKVGIKARLKSLEREIRAAITDGFQTFISGMARGVDIWAAEVVLRLRDNGSPIHLIAASPYQGFERAWSPAWQSRYASVLVGADIVRFVSLQYDRGCFQRRNEWMVDHAGRVQRREGRYEKYD